MISIGPKPTYNNPSMRSLMDSVYSQPFSPWREFAEGAVQGAATSPGIGTVYRNMILPTGAGGPSADTERMINAAPVMLQAPLRVLADGRGMYDRAMRELGLQEQPEPITQEDWRAGPYYRESIAWDEGMTEERAAAIAAQRDIMDARAQMLDRSSWDGPFGLRLPSVASFAGGFAGQMLDPINYIPVFGQAASAAAVGRYGWQGIAKISALTTGNAVDAAVSTALFGVMTASQRAKFGDDVSFEAQVSDIAMSALIGAAITPVLHGLGSTFTAGRRASSQVLKRFENVPTTKASRSILNDAVVGLATDGEVQLSPASLEALDRMKAEAEDRAAAATTLDRETRHLDSATVKAGKVIETPDGSRVEVQGRVVEASAVRVEAPSEAATMRAEEIAASLDPSKLMASADATTGAPMISPIDESGAITVEAGNARATAVQMAYQRGEGDAYRQALQDAGHDTTGFAAPMLVMERTTQLSPEAQQRFAVETNQATTARLTPEEITATDRAALTVDTMIDYAGGDVTSEPNQLFRERFLNNLAGPERRAFVDGKGNLTQQGKERIENALVMHAFGEAMPSVVSRFTAGKDLHSRTISGALADVADRWSNLRRLFKAGRLQPEFDITDELVMGLHNLNRWRSMAGTAGSKFSEVASDRIRPFDEADGKRMSVMAKTLVRMFYKTDDFGQVASREDIVARLNGIIDEAERLAAPRLVEDAEAAATLGITDAVDYDEASLLTGDDGAVGLGEVGVEAGQAIGPDPRTATPADRRGGPGIARTVKERVEAAGRSPEEGEALGAIVGDFYTTMAARLGVSTDELAERFGVPDFRYSDTVDEALAAQGALEQAPPVDSPEFKAWFGDSKAVDENGAPMVVYHGSWKQFDAFDPNARPVTEGGFVLEDAGVRPFFFTSRREVAEDFAGNVPENVMDVYLSLQNPLVIEAAGKGWDQFDDQVIAAARGGEHDGVILRSLDDSLFGELDDTVSDVFVAFQPTQIKSVNNTGAFDPNNANILMQGEAANDDGTGSVRPVSGQSAQAEGQNGGRQDDGSLRGLPRKVGDLRASAYPDAQRVAAQYMERAGLPYQPPNTYARVVPERATRIADAYEAMEHNPSDPEVQQAYQAMADETLAQYQAMLDDGMVIEFIDASGPDPYAGNPRLMTEDVRNNKHMWVFSTRDGFGSDTTFDPVDNPLLADSGHLISGQPAMINDIFRAVHDYFGHVKEGVGFRADGEENAWRAHSAMYSPAARRAMTTETRGQNSWVNYGPFGETNRTAKSEDTHYADQKIGLLPEWVAVEGAGDEVAAPVAAPDLLFQPPTTVESPAFQAWFRDSKAVDNDGDPLILYHGSASDFTSFSRERANIESDLGAGFYFTNTAEDVGANYAGEGPDLTQRIERAAERIAGELSNERGVEVRYDDPEVQALARERLAVEHGGSVYPVYLSIQNPVFIGGDTPSRIESGRADADDFMDEARDDLGPDADEDDVLDRAYELADEQGGEGGVAGMLDAMRGMEGDFDDFDVDRLAQDLSDDALLDGMDAEQLIAKMKDSHGLVYAVDENGDLATNEIIRRAFEAIGYDGFIDSTVNVKFGSERRVGQSMVGMDEGTVHYIAFRPEQIKSQFNSGTFDPANPNIMMQPGPANPRGAIQLDGPDNGSLVTLFRDADPSTALHEMGHHFLHMFTRIAERPDAPLDIQSDMSAIRQWWGSNASSVARDAPHAGVTPEDVLKVLREGTSGDDAKDLAIDVGFQEQWARGFEAYVREGKAPNKRLEGPFEQFRQWLVKVYKSVRDLNVKLSPEIRDVFDRMIDQDMALAVQRRDALAQAEAPPSRVDRTPPAAPRPVEGLAEAAARVMKAGDEEMRELAEQFSVKEDGSFVEEADIEAMRERGELTAEDEAELAEADATAKDADEWVKAMRAGAMCEFGAF